MNVNGISSGPVRSAQPVTPVQAVQPVQTETRDPRSSPLMEIDKKTNAPVPLKFPWLSRLSRELEQASGQPAPFSAGPDLGETLDTKA
jgi:hypothetical protein